MTKNDALLAAARWFDQGHYRDLIARRVAHPTHSDSGRPNPALPAYLDEEMSPYLSGMGFACERLDNPVAGQPPMMVARRIESKEAPTVLIYGHGDVISGQEAQWRAGLQPWTLTVEGDRWYGRGTADNKGQHTATLAALGQVIEARQGRLGYNVTVLLEMGEEVGSPGLREICAQERERLHADLLLASDGPRVHAQRPTVFLGSRGIVNFTLSLQSRDRYFHSGNWGGVLANPATIISHAIASMIDRHGRMRVPQLMPPPVSDAVRQALADVPIGGDQDDPTIDAHWGEPGLTASQRLMAWNTLEVLALGAGSAERPINAIPPRAVAHCQLRFVPGTHWEDLERIVSEHLAREGFPEIEVKVTAGTPATRLPLDNPWVQWCLDGVASATGKTPTLLPNLAGSLPNDAFAQILGMPTLWIPHSYPACSQHAPNEHLLAPVVREGLLAMTGLFWDLGETQHAPWYHGVRNASPDRTGHH